MVYPDDHQQSTLNDKQEVATDFDQEFFNLEAMETAEKIRLKIFWSKLRFNLIYLHSNWNNFRQRFPLVQYSIKRILFAIITLLLAISAIFIILRVITPNDTYLSDIDLAKLRISVGSPEYWNLLNERMKMFGVYGSIWEQLGNYLKNIMPFIKKTIHFNSAYDPITGKLVSDSYDTWFYLGIVFSPAVAQPGALVSDVFKNAMPYSFAFGIVALLIAYVIGVPLGILCGKYKEKPFDSTFNTTSIVFISIPPVVLVTGIYLISLNLFHDHGLFNSGTFDTKFWPTLAIVLMTMPPIVLTTRRYVIDEMTSDYTKFALSKGMSRQYIFYIHIFRNIGFRIFRLFPAAFVTTIFGASIFAEYNWAIPGMSKFIVAGVTAKDSFVVMAYILLTAVAGVVTSLFTDILMAVLDPRVKLTKN